MANNGDCLGLAMVGGYILVDVFSQRACNCERNRILTVFMFEILSENCKNHIFSAFFLLELGFMCQ